ncbi:MAG TPA: hypothetical protein VFJ82_08110 [Longimicrobium sp.]|nr:hypothetical protein [Longimicrobium sp.]
MRLHGVRAVLLGSLALSAGCKAKADAPAAGPPAARTEQRGDSPAPAANRPAEVRSEHVLLAVYWMEHGETSVEVFAVMPAAGGLAQPALDDSAAATNFYERWLKPGRGYTVLRGGARSGTITITDNDMAGCMALTAQTRAQVSEPGWFGAGLATDAPIARPTPVVGQPTDAERAAMTALLRREVEAKGGRWSGDARVDVLRVALSGGAAVVGSAALYPASSAGEDNRPRHAAFIIAEAGADGALRPAATWSHALSAGGEEDEEVERRLLDAADLDGDGTPEIVARTAMTESWRYDVYRRGPDGWAVVYTGGGGGC